MDSQTALNARTDLLWIVERWPRLQARLHGGGGNALTGMPSGSNEAPLPIDVAVSDLMREIEDQARFYAAVLLDEVPPEHGCDGQCVETWLAVASEATKAGQPTPPAPSSWDCPDRRDPITTSAMPALLAQVAERYGHFTQDEREALDFCDEAHDFRERVRTTLERPAPPTYVGPCRARGADGAGCSGELYLREGRDGGTCRECGTEFTHDEQQAYVRDALEDRLMTPAEIVRALKIVGHEVKPGTVFKWVQREKLEEVVDGLYRLADALDLAERPRRKQVAA
ncbi:hypothetical protein [Oerskovia enterophila]|uniref:Helix-turn-helix DNA binding domain protein n=1 Tax=Oerskovia enterophila TaxID=43678 RepID=A0ABX2Y3D6_9CELL|nr:hypothetical protein [Oerskovia enterophila]OCI31062.1 hypothetical protein OERS_22720 [Oerskovia enterophila]